MLIHRTQSRLLLGLALLLALLLAGAASAWYEMSTEPKAPPAGSRLVGRIAKSGA